MSSGYRVCPARNGATLAEVLVALVIALVLLVAAVDLFIYGYRSYLQAVARIELQQTASLALGRLLGDLDQTPPAGLSLGAATARDSGLAMVPLDTVTADSRPVFQSLLVVYHADLLSGSLFRKAYAVLPPLPGGQSLSPSLPPVLAQADLETLFADPGGGGVRLAQGVSRFEVTRSGSPPDLMPLRIALELVKEVPGMGAQRFGLWRDYCLRNR